LFSTLDEASTLKVRVFYFCLSEVIKTLAEQSNRPGWATYLRVSDEDRQHPERSFAFQRQWIEEQLLVASALPFVIEYHDILTGKTPKRADYQRMLQDAADGYFSHLGLYRADRFGRNAVEGLHAATILIDHGIKIRVAHMPSLQPETPDGFFMFLVQMGLAQRETEVTMQRATDGMEAKLRSGGWSFKAPDGYVNKEEQIASGKYRRWVEPDPQQARVWREAWDMLLTNRYTLAEISEELHARGYTRASGKPWVWTDPKTGTRKTAANKLSRGFHRPFYAGWVVSKHFGISYGEVRGNWTPIITPEEFEKGLAILKRHDAYKSRSKRHQYLLRGLIWMDIDGKRYKMYCSTPSGRNSSYRYYVTHSKLDSKRHRLKCEDVEYNVFDWLRGIHVPTEMHANIRHIYEIHLKQLNGPTHEEKLGALEERIRRIQAEETDLARLLVTGRLSEEAYDNLRREWQTKLFQAKRDYDMFRREAQEYLDDLDVALVLLSRVQELFPRLNYNQQIVLLRILAKRIIVSTHGDIIDHELHPPFSYLAAISNDYGPPGPKECGSNQVPLIPPVGLTGLI